MTSYLYTQLRGILTVYGTGNKYESVPIDYVSVYGTGIEYAVFRSITETENREEDNDGD